MSDAPVKKRRLVNGQELVFRRPGEESDDDEDGHEDVGPAPSTSRNEDSVQGEPVAAPVAEAQRIVIHEED